jgi:Leucine-rich repeat (LRR) protein
MIHTPGPMARGSSIRASSDLDVRCVPTAVSNGALVKEALERSNSPHKYGNSGDYAVYPRNDGRIRAQAHDGAGWDEQADMPPDHGDGSRAGDERPQNFQRSCTRREGVVLGSAEVQSPQMPYLSTSGCYPPVISVECAPDGQNLQHHDYGEDGVQESVHYLAARNDNSHSGNRPTYGDEASHLPFSSSRNQHDRLDNQDFRDPYLDRLEHRDIVLRTAQPDRRTPASYGHYRPLQLAEGDVDIKSLTRESPWKLSPRPLRERDVTRDAPFAVPLSGEEAFADRPVTWQPGQGDEVRRTRTRFHEFYNEQRTGDASRSSRLEDRPHSYPVNHSSVSTEGQNPQAGYNASGPRYPRTLFPISPTRANEPPLQYADHMRNSRLNRNAEEAAGIPAVRLDDDESPVSLDEMRKIEVPKFVQNLEGMPGSKKGSLENSPRVVPVSSLGRSRNDTLQSRMRPRGGESNFIHEAGVSTTRELPQIPRRPRSTSPEDDMQNQVLAAVNRSCRRHSHLNPPGSMSANGRGQSCASDVPESIAVQALRSEQPRRVTRRSLEYNEASPAEPRDGRGQDSSVEKRPSLNDRNSDFKKPKVSSLSGCGRSIENSSPERLHKSAKEPSELGSTKHPSSSGPVASSVVSIDLDGTAGHQTEDGPDDVPRLSLDWHVDIPYNSEAVRARVSRFTEFASDLRTVNIGFCGLESKHLEEIVPDLARSSTLSLLYAENNKLECIPGNFEVLCKIHNLESIVLRSNCLTEFPNVLLSCTALTFLNLSRNRLTSVPLGLSKLENVQCLELSHNLLTDLPGPGFGTMKNLQVLKLDHNRLSALPDDFGKCNSSLTVLDISQNAEFCGGLPAFVRNLSGQLEDLVMQDTGVMSKLPRKYLKASAAELIELMAGASETEILLRIETSKSDSSARRSRRPSAPSPSRDIDAEKPLVAKREGACVKAVDTGVDGR